MIITIVLYYIVGEKESLEGINLGANRKLGNIFIILSKYIFIIITVIVIILGLIYGGIG
ncbi:hypothetical protein [Clostridium botulinum]|uniref:hypothetical protein n=1 Tax=Clostridium botulinum TaxID=1491 RepID=UPI003A806D2F